MSCIKNHLFCLGVTALSLGWAGCQTHTKVVPLSAGYEAVEHPYHTLMDEPKPPRISLQWRGTDGAITRVWPALYSADTVIKGNIVIFAAEKAYTEPERVTHARLFAARPSELPLDLTDEVLWRWAKTNGKAFDQALQKFAGITAAENAGALDVHLEFWANSEFGDTREEWPDTSSLRLDWAQVEAIMRAVKAKGTVEKDLRWHTEYIGEKF
jgi:hypothetical protein